MGKRGRNDERISRENEYEGPDERRAAIAFGKYRLYAEFDAAFREALDSLDKKQNCGMPPFDETPNTKKTTDRSNAKKAPFPPPRSFRFTCKFCDTFGRI